jgi:hypothetical protein
MDPARRVDIEELRRDIEATRASISRTTSALRGKAGDAMHWQTYFERYPIASLLGAALVGAVAGRRIAHGMAGDDSPRPWVSSTPGVEAVARIPARFRSDGETHRAVTASWHRFGGRVEGLVNRVIDDVADAVERSLLPALAGTVETYLAGRVGGASASGRYPAQDAGGGRVA